MAFQVPREPLQAAPTMSHDTIQAYLDSPLVPDEGIKVACYGSVRLTAS